MMNICMCYVKRKLSELRLYTSKYEFNCKFNDSILTDEEAERKQDMADVAAGFMHHWEYRMKWYNEDEATAKANVPAQNNVME